MMNNRKSFIIGVKSTKLSSKEKNFLSILGEEIGLLFQLTDDFLDIKGNKKLVGKECNILLKKVDDDLSVIGEIV